MKFVLIFFSLAVIVSVNKAIPYEIEKYLQHVGFHYWSYIHGGMQHYNPLGFIWPHASRTWPLTNMEFESLDAKIVITSNCKSVQDKYKNKHHPVVVGCDFFKRYRDEFLRGGQDPAAVATFLNMVRDMGNKASNISNEGGAPEQEKIAQVIEHLRNYENLKSLSQSLGICETVLKSENRRDLDDDTHQLVLGCQILREAGWTESHVGDPRPITDNGLEGERPSTDNSLEGERPSTDNSLEGERPSTDNSLEGERPSTDNGLENDSKGNSIIRRICGVLAKICSLSN